MQKKKIKIKCDDDKMNNRWKSGDIKYQNELRMKKISTKIPLIADNLEIEGIN